MVYLMLEGIRVVDFTRYLPGPYATLRLADMGAEVIKVESPGTGDPARVMGDGFVYRANNHKKKSVTINLKSTKGQALAVQLACQADVVVEGFRPGVADALGIGYEELQKVRPEIIYCSISGYGQTGPLSKLGGHDLNYMALSGVLSQLTDQEGSPSQPGIQLADMLGGIVASEAILAALINKPRTGKGKFLDISLTGALTGLMNLHQLIHKEIGDENGLPELRGTLISYRLYETQDGRYISLCALERKFWENFCLAVGQEKWIDDHLSQAAEENQTFREVKALFKSRTFAQWSRFSCETDCCLAPVLGTGELQLTSLHNPPPPSLGQHNKEILQGMLNASSEQMAAWEQLGII